MTSQLEDISATAEELSGSAIEVTKSVMTIASGMDNLSHYTEVVLQSVDEQSASMQAVNTVSQDLCVQAENYKSLHSDSRHNHVILEKKSNNPHV